MHQKRIYVSAFELKPDPSILPAGEYSFLTDEDAVLFTNWKAPAHPSPASRLLPRRGIDLVRALHIAGMAITWYLDCWQFGRIKQDIARSDALLAITDKYYFSSTGKAIELTYATGQRASGENPPIKPIPVFIFPIDDAYLRYRHLERPGNWTALHADVARASAQVLGCLG